jgi:DNA polymerase I-like protein with 3'-5' exonuclease and polymerase domains
MRMIELVIDTETTNKNPHKAEPLGIASYINNIATYRTGQPDLDLHGAYIITHNGKYDAVVLRKAGCPSFKIDFDTIVAHYILHIDEPRKLETLAKKHLKWNKKTLLDIFNDHNTEQFELHFKKKFATRKNLPDPTKNQGNWYEDFYDAKGKLRHFGVPMETVAEYAKEDVKATAMLKPIFAAELEKRPELKKWFEETEMPYVNILTESELKGVAVDVVEAERLKKMLEEDRDKLGSDPVQAVRPYRCEL